MADIHSSPNAAPARYSLPSRPTTAVSVACNYGVIKHEVPCKVASRDFQIAHLAILAVCRTLVATQDSMPTRTGAASLSKSLMSPIFVGGASISAFVFAIQTFQLTLKIQGLANIHTATVCAARDARELMRNVGSADSATFAGAV